MKKTLFRKDSLLTKSCAVALSVTLAFGMTPAAAFAQPTANSEDGIALLADSDVDSAKALIAALPGAAQVTAAEKGTYDSQINAAVAAYEALDQAGKTTIDTDMAPSTSQSYGRVLESAEWAMKAIADCDNSTTLADNTYTETTTPALNSEYSKGKSTSSRERPWSITDVTVANGKATGTVTVASSSYTYIYMGGKKIENSAPSGSNSTFKNVPIDLNSTQYLSAYSTSMRTEIVFSLTSTIDEPSVTPTTTVSEIATEDITNETGMFKVAAAQIETTGDKSVLRFTLNGASVVELFQGTYEEAVANGDGTKDKGNDTWIHGTTDVMLPAGKVEFVMPIEQGEHDYVITSISSTHYNNYLNGTEEIGKCMYPRHIKVSTDDLTLVSGDYSATRDLAVTVTGDAPAITSASLLTVGGPASNNYKEELTIATAAQAAYVGTAEEAAAATSGVVEAQNGSITIGLTGNNYGGSGAGFTGVVALALKGADGTWVDTTATIDKAAKTITIAGVALPEAPAAKATVSYAAQAVETYLAAPAQSVEVSGDLAESYGFTDSIPAAEGVSAADVLVAANIAVYGSDFTKDTASTYLAWNGAGYVSKLFGIETTANGFLVNKAVPNDGTESSYGGYNGTTITTTKVNSGDVVDFFVYQDTELYTDKLTYIDAPDQVRAGKAFDVTVTSVSAMNGYMYKDAAAMKAAAKAAEGVKLGVMNAATGAVTEIEGVTTDANGKANITLAEAGDYYLVATGTDDTDSPSIMNPTKIAVSEGLAKGHYSIDMTVTKPDGSAYGMFAPVDPVVEVTDDGIYLTFRVERKTYYGIFLGAKADASQESDRYFAGTIMNGMGSKGTLTDLVEFKLKLSEEELNASQDLTLFGGSKKTWYGTQLTLNLSNLSAQPGIGASAQNVINLINAIPAPESLVYSDGAAIRAARHAYDALNSVRVTEVTNLDKLVAAEEAYSLIPIVWPALQSGYDELNGNNFTADPDYMVAYNDNNSNIFIRIYVDSRHYNRAFAKPASEVTASTTGGTLTSVTDSDAGYIQFSAKEVQLGKTFHYTLAQIENGEVTATKEISFTMPSFRGHTPFAEGTYEMVLQSDAEALNGVAATVVSDGSAMTATVTPKSAIVKAFAGTAEAAAAATEGFIEPNEQGALVLPIAQADIPTSIAIFDGTKWTDQRVQIVADAATQEVINAIQAIYADGVDENGKALTREVYWDVYPSDRAAVNAASEKYLTLTEAQKAVLGQSNESILLHAAAMFNAADSVSAEIAALPDTAEGISSEMANYVKFVKNHYDTCGSGIFDWYPSGEAQGIQARYVQKLIPTADKEKLQTLSDAVAGKILFTLDFEKSTVKPGETMKVNIVATSDSGLSAAQFKLNFAGSAFKVTSIEKGAGLVLDGAEGVSAGSFESTLETGMVTFYGNTADASTGIVVATITLEASELGTSTLTLSDAVCGISGSTMDIEDALLPATCEFNVAYPGDFKVSTYVESSNIKLITFVGEVPEGMVPTMKGVPMYEGGTNVYVALATAEEAAALTRADFDVVEGSAQGVIYNGDVTLNDKINIVDAQVAYDIATAVYADFSIAPVESFLVADVNEDASVDAADAFAIQRFVLTGEQIED